MKLTFGTRELEAGGEYLAADLRESNDLLNDWGALRDRLDQDGYLLLRGLHDRDAVLRVRRQILEHQAQDNALDPGAPLMEGVINPASTIEATTSVRKNEKLVDATDLRELVEGPRVTGLFENLFGEKALTFQHKWLRIAGTGASSKMHCDAVYMGRGSKNLYTCWTPLGDVTLDMGPVVLCPRSHQIEKIKNTYGRMDVDRDLIQGWFFDDPVEFIDKFGGCWSTSTFQAGDALIFGLHLIHASLVNTTNKLRISVDTRFQPASEPIDERWGGDHPTGHYAFWQPGVKLEPIEVSRARWGV